MCQIVHRRGKHNPGTGNHDLMGRKKMTFTITLYEVILPDERFYL